MNTIADNTETLYHVAAPDYDGGDILSLREQLGHEEAVEEYTRRWPEAGNLSEYHTGQVHLHSTLAEAQEFQAEFGGIILAVDADQIDWHMDTLEYPHPVADGSIDADAICAI